MATANIMNKLEEGRVAQDISVRHTAKMFGGNIVVLFYDVTTLYFEADYENDLRKTGFSK